MKTTLTLRERDEALIPDKLAHCLEKSRALRLLIEDGKLKLVFGKRGWVLRANQFVGSAILEDGTCIEITEKTAGAFQGLLAAATSTDVSVTRVPGAQSEYANAVAFIRPFLFSLQEALRQGRPRAWVKRREVSCTPRGILDIPGTILERSRGHRHLVAQQTNSITANILINQLLKLGLGVCDRWICRASTRPDEVASQVRRAMLSFADIDASVLVRMNRTQLADSFRRAYAAKTYNSEHARALAFARTIVLQTFAGTSGEQRDQSFFWNLEELFESAVRSVVMRVEALRTSEVFDGEDRPQYLFVDNKARFGACPDIVVRSQGRHILVADCKYVDLDDRPEDSLHSHVYQLLAHAKAFKATNACLFYPGSEFGEERLGVTSDGTCVRSFTVRPGHLQKDIGRAVADALSMKRSPAGPV